MLNFRIYRKIDHYSHGFEVNPVRPWNPMFCLLSAEHWSVRAQVGMLLPAYWGSKIA